MSDQPDKVIYSMTRVSKFYNKKPVLKDIYLSYFYGAKIGVLGLNGAAFRKAARERLDVTYREAE